jgi:hypothetical protein
VTILSILSPLLFILSNYDQPIWLGHHYLVWVLKKSGPYLRKRGILFVILPSSKLVLSRKALSTNVQLSLSRLEFCKHVCIGCPHLWHEGTSLYMAVPAAHMNTFLGCCFNQPWESWGLKSWGGAVRVLLKVKVILPNARSLLGHLLSSIHLTSTYAGIRASKGDDAGRGYRWLPTAKEFLACQTDSCVSGMAFLPCVASHFKINFHLC